MTGYIVAFVIAMLVTIYLFVALLFPERFLTWPSTSSAAS